MKPSIFFRFIFKSIESVPFSLTLWATSFLALITFRLGIDLIVEGLPQLTLFQFFFQWAHLLLFFLFSYLLLLPLIMAVGKTSLEKAARVLLLGFLVILFPPVIDKIIFGDGLYWSFYIFDSFLNMSGRFITFFGEKPHLGITYGVRIEVALVLLGTFCYGLVKTGLFLRTLALTFFAYVILFFLGTIPSWISYVVLAPSQSLLTISGTNIAELFLSPQSLLGRDSLDLRSALSAKMTLFLVLFNFILALGIWFWNKRLECISFLQNVRWPQIFYHNGLWMLGMLLALLYTEARFELTLFTALAFANLTLAVTAAWLASVLWNDLADVSIDAKTNPTRPLITGALTCYQYRTYAFALFFFSVFVGAVISFKVALLLVLYQALATLYSKPPFRLKKFLGIATLMASFAGIVLLLIGYILLEPENTLRGLPVSLMLYLTMVLAFIIPLKDFKDVEGDKADRVFTLPVLFGVRRAKIIMSTLTFLVFVSSIFILHAPELLLWALLFGSLSFWLVQRAGTKKSRVQYQNLSGVFMALAFLYGVGLVIFLL